MGLDSEGYSVLKAAAFANGYITADQAKEEIHVHEQLLTLYKGLGFVPHFGAHAFLSWRIARGRADKHAPAKAGHSASAMMVMRRNALRLLRLTFGALRAFPLCS